MRPGPPWGRGWARTGTLGPGCDEAGARTGFGFDAQVPLAREFGQQGNCPDPPQMQEHSTLSKAKIRLTSGEKETGKGSETEWELRLLEV